MNIQVILSLFEVLIIGQVIRLFERKLATSKVRSDFLKTLNDLTQTISLKLEFMPKLTLSGKRHLLYCHKVRLDFTLLAKTTSNLEFTLL